MSAIATVRALIEVHRQETLEKTSGSIPRASSSSAHPPSPASSTHSLSSSPPPSRVSTTSPTPSRTSSPGPAQPVDFTFLSPLFYNQKMWVWHLLQDVYQSLARSMNRNPFALLMLQYSIALVHGATIYLLSVLLSLAHLLVIAATMERQLGWRSGFRLLRTQWDIRLPEMLDFEPQAEQQDGVVQPRHRHRYSTRLSSSRQIRSSNRASSPTTTRQAISAKSSSVMNSGWNDALHHRLTRWNRWAVPRIWAPVSSTEQEEKEEYDTQEEDYEEIDDDDNVDTTVSPPPPLLRFSEGVDNTADESYPSRLRKAFVKTLSGGFKPALTNHTTANHAKTTNSTRKKVTFSEKVVIWGRRRSSLRMPAQLVSPFSKGPAEETSAVRYEQTLTNTVVSDAVSVFSSLSSTSTFSMTFEAPQPPLAVTVDRPSSAQQSPHQQQQQQQQQQDQQLEVGSKTTMPSSDVSCHQTEQQHQQQNIHTSGNNNSTDLVPGEKANVQEQLVVDKSGISPTVLTTRPSQAVTAAYPDLSTSTIAITTTTKTSDTALATPQNPSMCRKAASASDLSSAYTVHTQQETLTPAGVHQAGAARHDLRRAVSVPVMQFHHCPSSSSQPQQDSLAMAAQEVARPDSRASTTSSSSTLTLPATTASRSVEFVLPTRSASLPTAGTTRPSGPSGAATANATTATMTTAKSTSTTSRRLSISLGTRARRSLSFVLPGQPQEQQQQQQQQIYSMKQQQQTTSTLSTSTTSTGTTATSSNGNGGATSVGVERQSSLKRNNLMYRIVHPQRYKRELVQEQEAQDRERLRFLVRLQHHQLMNEGGQNGFPACPETLKWMLQIEGRTKQQLDVMGGKEKKEGEKKSDDDMASSSSLPLPKEQGEKKKRKKSTTMATTMKKKASSSSLASSTSQTSSIATTSSSSLSLPSVVLSPPSETSDIDFLHPQYDYTFPLSAEWVTGLGAPGSMISTSVGTQFPSELQQQEHHPLHHHHHHHHHHSPNPHPVTFDELAHTPAEAQNHGAHGFHLFRKQAPVKRASTSSLPSTTATTTHDSHSGRTASTSTTTNSDNYTNHRNTFPRRVQQLFHPGHAQTQSTSSLVDQHWTIDTRGGSTEPTDDIATAVVATVTPPPPPPSSLKPGQAKGRISTAAAAAPSSSMSQPVQTVYYDNTPYELATKAPNVRDQTSFAAFGFPATTTSTPTSTATSVTVSGGAAVGVMPGMIMMAVEEGLVRTKSSSSPSAGSTSSLVSIASAASSSLTPAGTPVVPPASLPSPRKRPSLTIAMLGPLRRRTSSSSDVGQQQQQQQPLPTPPTPPPKQQPQHQQSQQQHQQQQQQKRAGRMWRTRRQAKVEAAGATAKELSGGEVEVLADESALDDAPRAEDEDLSQLSSGSGSGEGSFLSSSSSSETLPLPQRKLSVGKVLMQKLTPRKKQGGPHV
ncbi:hypothetical protein DFQ26_009732 [Actinomortierella ambigua]|nr:hypothetical protein DFQ26_009732 [Actinomortierella ambigua]